MFCIRPNTRTYLLTCCSPSLSFSLPWVPGRWFSGAKAAQPKPSHERKNEQMNETVCTQHSNRRKEKRKNYWAGPDWSIFFYLPTVPTAGSPYSNVWYVWPLCCTCSSVHSFWTNLFLYFFFPPLSSLFIFFTFQARHWLLFSTLFHIKFVDWRVHHFFFWNEGGQLEKKPKKKTWHGIAWHGIPV